MDTYVFEAAPKRMEKNHHYFQGRVWVDQQDLQIVLINGKTVPQDVYKRQLLVQRSHQSSTVWYQSCEFCGFSTQWPSSGK